MLHFRKGILDSLKPETILTILWCFMIPSSVHFGDTKKAYSNEYNNIVLCHI